MICKGNAAVNEQTNDNTLKSFVMQAADFEKRCKGREDEAFEMCLKVSQECIEEMVFRRRSF